MYLRMKDRSSTCAWPWSRVYALVPVAVVAMFETPSSALGDRVSLRHPAVVVCLRVDGHDGAHAVVSQAAKFRASELVCSFLRRLEPNTNVHPGHSILLNPKGRDE